MSRSGGGKEAEVNSKQTNPFQIDPNVLRIFFSLIALILAFAVKSQIFPS
jgi:hypothetical protein